MLPDDAAALMMSCLCLRHAAAYVYYCFHAADADFHAMPPDVDYYFFRC